MKVDGWVVFYFLLGLAFLAFGYFDNALQAGVIAASFWIMLSIGNAVMNKWES